MLWGANSIASATDSDSVEALSNARFLLSFNEPQQSEQADLSPLQAAELWPQVVAIAQNYTLELVAPCLKNGNDDWYDVWLANCTGLYGSPCAFDYTCTHLYLYPEPCALPWGCARTLPSVLERWWVKYARPMWVTEFACSPWAAATAAGVAIGAACNASVHARLMEQMVPLLEASDRVFRYAWYALYEDSGMPGNGLNEDVFRIEPGRVCEPNLWVANRQYGSTTSLPRCVHAVQSNANCAQTAPLLALSYESGGNQNCYCAPASYGADACNTTTATWNGIVTYVPAAGVTAGVLSPLGELYYTFEGQRATPTALPPPRIPPALLPPALPPRPSLPVPPVPDPLPSHSNLPSWVPAVGVVGACLVLGLLATAVFWRWRLWSKGRRVARVGV